MVLKIPAWAQWKLWSLQEAVGQKSKEVFFIFQVFMGFRSLSPLAAVISGVPGLLSHILWFLKAVLKIHLEQIKKCSKIDLCILGKLCQLCLPPTEYSLDVEKLRSIPAGSVNSTRSWIWFFGSKDLPPYDSWVFQAGWDAPPVQKEMRSTGITLCTLRHQQFPWKGHTWSTLEKERAHLSTWKEEWSPGGSMEVSFSWQCYIPQDCCFP